METYGTSIWKKNRNSVLCALKKLFVAILANIIVLQALLYQTLRQNSVSRVYHQKYLALLIMPFAPYTDLIFFLTNQFLRGK